MASENLTPALFAVYNIFYALAVIFTVLRLIARRISRVGFWWDDYFILSATLVQTVGEGFLMTALVAGGGKHIQDVNPSNIQTYIIMAYANEYIWVVSITFIQLSLLFLYLRLFSVNNIFRRFAYAYIALVTAWAISLLFSTVFQCTPVTLPYTEGPDEAAPNCIDYHAWLIGTNILHIFIDFSMLLLPITQVWKLSLSRNQKIGLSLVFLLGIFTSAVSVVRTCLNASLALNDPTWNYTSVQLWLGMEAWIGILTSCLPTIRPLARHYFGDGRKSKLGGGSYSETNGPPQYNAQRQQSKHLGEIKVPSRARGYNKDNSLLDRAGNNYDVPHTMGIVRQQDDAIILRHIHLTHEYDVTSHSRSENPAFH